MAISFAACFFNADDEPDIPSTPSEPEQTLPETPSYDNSDEDGDDIIVPDDPVIDPNDPVIDPDDPVVDIPPEDVPPQDNPPGGSGTSDFPKSIYEVDSVDEINYFADEFVQILNDNYLDNIAHEMIYINDASDFEYPKWRILEVNNNIIKKLEITVYHSYGTTRYFSVGRVTFNQEYCIQDIIDGNAINATYSIAIMRSTSLNNLTTNLDLGKTVISTIDPDNTLEGDIWCSIGFPTSIAGNTYREIIVYQITNSKVLKFAIWSLANGTSDPEIIQNNILNNKTNGSGIQSTEYTFTGMKIEQIPLPTGK